MTIDIKKAQELAKNSEFIATLSQVYNDKQKFIDLFKQQGIDISEKEYKEFLKSNEKLLQYSEEELKKISKCSEEELEKISGGWVDNVNRVNITNVYNNSSPRNSSSCQTSSEQMPAIIGVGIGLGMTLISSAFTLYAVHKCATKGPFSKL